MMIFRLWQNALLDKVQTRYTIIAASQDQAEPEMLIYSIIRQHDNKNVVIFA